MNFNFIKFFSAEFRRIKWASKNKTLNSFLITLVTIVIFASIIFLFSWGILELIKVF